MSPKEEIRYSLMMFPSIHKNKLDVYDHLFLVNGNGYEWRNGELVVCSKEDIDVNNLKTTDSIDNIFNSRDFSMNLLKSTIKCYISTEEPISEKRAEIISVMIMDLFKQQLSTIHETVKQVLPETIDKAELDMTLENTSKGFELYPICEYSKIMMIPDDITEEWKYAVREFYEFIMNSQEPEVIRYREEHKETINKIDTTKFI